MKMSLDGIEDLWVVVALLAQPLKRQLRMTFQVFFHAVVVEVMPQTNQGPALLVLVSVERERA